MRSVLQLLKPILLLAILVELTGCADSKKINIDESAADVVSPVNHLAAKEALQLRGHPYVYGGESPGEGFDCSGLVYYVYNKVGLKLPRDTGALVRQLPSIQLAERQPGDLLFFTVNSHPFGHVGIYVGEDKFVHAPSTQTGKVMMSDLKQPYWRERFAAVRRPLSPQPLSLLDDVQKSCVLN